MRLVRYEPFSLSRDFHRFFADFDPPLRNQWAPSVDVIENEGSLKVRVEAPGIDADALDITVEGDTLSVSGSRHFEDEVKEEGYQRKELFQGSFRRSIQLPEGVDVEAISATSKDGIVTVTIPKSPEVLPHKVKVEIAN